MFALKCTFRYDESAMYPSRGKIKGETAGIPNIPKFDLTVKSFKTR